MKLEMKNGYLAVKPLKGEIETKGGFILTENDDDAQTSSCEIVAATEDSEYNVGDIVMFSKLVPDDVIIKDKKGSHELWFVKETDIKAIVKNDREREN